MVGNSLIDQVMLILVDDVWTSHFLELIGKRRFPNITQLAENGINFQNCFIN